MRSVRDKAIILLGFAGGFRRSELVALNVEDLVDDKDGIRILLKRSKTDQDGKGRTVAIVKGAHALTCPVSAVQAWLRAANIKEGGDNPLFYPVNRWGGVELNRLSDRAVYRIVKGACRAARKTPRHRLCRRNARRARWRPRARDRRQTTGGLASRQRGRFCHRL